MKIFLRLFILAIFGGIIYSLFWGPFVFMNPIQIQYERISGSRADVYAHDITKLDVFYYEIDIDMEQAEEFTGLKFKQKPVVFVAQDIDEFARFIPWVKDNKNTGAFSLPVKSIIYINSEKIKQLEYREREFFRHELMRVLISQNTTEINKVMINNQEWFIKGVATHFGGPKYLTDLEFVQQFDEKTPGSNLVSSNVFINLSEDEKFNYTLYGLFIKYLIDTYGIDTFRLFTKRYLEVPNNFRVIFYEVYAQKMNFEIDEFLKSYKLLSK